MTHTHLCYISLAGKSYASIDAPAMGLLGRPGYAVVVLPDPHTMLVDQLAPEVDGEPDEQGTKDRQEQGLATRSVPA